MSFQSTLSVRRATLPNALPCLVNVISIHALREESDIYNMITGFYAPAISIHALREESDAW